MVFWGREQGRKRIALTLNNVSKLRKKASKLKVNLPSKIFF